MAKSDRFYGGRLGKEGEAMAKNKRLGESLARKEEGFKKAREAAKEITKDFGINNVVKMKDEETTPEKKRLGLGRVIGIDTQRGTLKIRFHSGVKEIKADFVDLVSKM